MRADLNSLPSLPGVGAGVSGTEPQEGLGPAVTALLLPSCPGRGPRRAWPALPRLPTPTSYLPWFPSVAAGIAQLIHKQEGHSPVGLPLAVTAPVRQVLLDAGTLQVVASCHQNVYHAQSLATTVIAANSGGTCSHVPEPAALPLPRLGSQSLKVRQTGCHFTTTPRPPQPRGLRVGTVGGERLVAAARAPLAPGLRGHSLCSF